MRCLMTVVVDGPDDRGWLRRRCERRGCTKRTNWTPDPPERIGFRCTGWPHNWEIGSWLALFLAAIGISQDRFAWAVHKLGLIEVADESCGCAAREQWLNTLGGRIYTLAKAGNRFAKVAQWWLVKTQNPNTSIASDAP